MTLNTLNTLNTLITNRVRIVCTSAAVWGHKWFLDLAKVECVEMESCEMYSN